MVCVLEYTSLGVEGRIVSQVLALRTLYKASFLSLHKRDISAVNQPRRTPQQCKGVRKKQCLTPQLARRGFTLRSEVRFSLSSAHA